MIPNRWMLIVLIAALLVGCSAPLSKTQTDLPGWELVWQDEFDGDTINPENWLYDIGAGGWGNNEWQFYTNRPENARVENGLLIIEAREENYKGSDYTSARLKTQELHTFTYGRMEASMKLPQGKGVWSAFWMLGADFTTVGWPNSGEIDIMENIGNPYTVYGTIHGPGYSGGSGIGDSHTISASNFAEEFHIYAVEWEPGEIRWYVDETLFNTIKISDVPGEWVYDHPFFIIVNLAIGGLWPGYPDQTTQFPQQLMVDYIRVYRDPSFSLDDLQEGTLHASRMSIEWQEEEQWASTIHVTVTDQNGEPVEGAVVSAGWLGAVSGATIKAETNENGVAGPFTGNKVKSAKEVSFCITNISKALYEYDKNSNSQTCVFSSPPGE